MKIKKEYIILAVIIAALIVYLVSRNSDRTLYDLPQMESVQAKDITRIELKTSGETIVFNKEGSDWKISPENYPADPQKVEAMLSVVEGLTLTELISESKNYGRYDLDPAEAIELKCWAKDELRREMSIGKSADSFNHTFVKLPGNDAVYQTGGNFRNKFDMEKGEFREKTVLSFEKETISEIEIRMSETAETFKKAEAQKDPSESEEKKETGAAGPEADLKWVDARGGEAEIPKIKSLLSTLSDLKCEAFLEGKTKAEYSEPAYEITLKGEKEYRLSIYSEIEKEGETYFPAVSSENDYPFLITEWRAENIMKKPEALLK